MKGADGHRVVYLLGLMTDNPGMDVEEYRKQLAYLDPVTRKQLEEGDWDVQLSGGVLDVTKLKYFTAGEFSQRVRYWDLAATEQKEGVDPDWTAAHEDHAPDLAAGVGVPVPLPRQSSA